MRNARYNTRQSEPKWQKVWEDHKTFLTRNEDSRPKYYVLEMFPYPSGRIHMGHVRNYAMGDVVARHKRAKGFSVLHPMACRPKMPRWKRSRIPRPGPMPTSPR